jgi:hypothetical protein
MRKVGVVTYYKISQNFYGGTDEAPKIYHNNRPPEQVLIYWRSKCNRKDDSKSSDRNLNFCFTILVRDNRMGPTADAM